MADTPRFFNRELSWLEFNQRVLDEARDETIPGLERLKFLAISGSNLDEFFMVRVGGLRVLIEQGLTSPDPSGMTPAEQLTAVTTRVRQMVAEQYLCFSKELEPLLAEAGIRRLSAKELSERQRKALEQVFENEIFSTLTPMAVAAPENFPLLPNLSLSVGVQLKPAADSANPRFAIIPLGRTLSRLLTVGSDKGYAYILLEDIIGLFLDRFFPGEEIVAQ